MIVNLTKSIRVRSEPLTWVLESLYVAESGKRKGEVQWKTLGYYGHLENAIKRAARILLHENEGEEFDSEGLLRAIADLDQMIHDTLSRVADSLYAEPASKIKRVLPPPGFG